MRIRTHAETLPSSGSSYGSSESLSDPDSGYEKVNPPEQLRIALRAYWKAVMEAEALADEFARKDDQGSSKFHYFTQLTPELEFVVPTAPGRFVKAMQTPSSIDCRDSSEDAVSLSFVRCPSPEVEALGSKSLSLEWTEETFLPDGRRWLTEKLADDDDMRSRKCVYLDRLKEPPLPIKFANLTMVMKHGKTKAKVEIDQKETPILVAASSSPDSVLKRSRCPICYRPFRASRSALGNEDTQRMAVPRCGHVLCGECAHQLVMGGGTACPTCRSPLKNFWPLALVTELRRKTLL